MKSKKIIVTIFGILVLAGIGYWAHWEELRYEAGVKDGQSQGAQQGREQGQKETLQFFGNQLYQLYKKHQNLQFTWPENGQEIVVEFSPNFPQTTTTSTSSP